MVCRGPLPMLHRAGEIELPALRQVSLNPFLRRGKPQPVLVPRLSARPGKWLWVNLCALNPCRFPPQLCRDRRRSVRSICVSTLLQFYPVRSGHSLRVKTADRHPQRLGHGRKLAGAVPDLIAAACHFSSRTIDSTDILRDLTRHLRCLRHLLV